ncbi:uncharacterized protein [Aquarana catesbeiana]|uniref:uncharacterized protein n=1 Tax=Aquarana catesbeiana TaxID=8400 RepID=UPI003CC9A3C9
MSIPGAEVIEVHRSIGHIHNSSQKDEGRHIVLRNVPEEIFTRLGSDLLLPIRHHLTLNHTDRGRCDLIDWIYKDPTRPDYTRIFLHYECTLKKYEKKFFTNTRLSENGSLIISNVTPENDGIYIVIVYNSTGERIQRDYYIVHVEGQVWSRIRHFLSPIAVFVFYTVLLIFIVNDLRKMKNEKNRSERKTRRRDQMEMEMEPTYYNDRN